MKTLILAFLVAVGTAQAQKPFKPDPRLMQTLAWQSAHNRSSWAGSAYSQMRQQHLQRMSAAQRRAYIQSVLRNNPLRPLSR